MGTKTFSTETILRTMIPEAEAWHKEHGEELTAEELARWIYDIICDCDIVGTDKFENIKQLVFEHEGRHWSCEFETNSGAGYIEFFGASWMEKSPPFTKAGDGSWVFNEKNIEEESFTCIEVKKVTKTIVTWEKV